MNNLVSISKQSALGSLPISVPWTKIRIEVPFIVLVGAFAFHSHL